MIEATRSSRHRTVSARIARFGKRLAFYLFTFVASLILIALIFAMFIALAVYLGNLVLAWLLERA